MAAKKKQSKKIKKTSRKKTTKKSGKEETPKVAERTSSKRYPNKKLLIVSTLLVLIAALYFSRGLFIAAMVNGQPISRLEVIKILEQRQGEQALDNLITETLIKQEARKEGITVSQDEVGEQVGEIEANLTAQGQTLESALAFQGMTREDLERQVELQALIEKLLADGVEVTDEEVSTYIEENEELFPEGLSDEEKENQAREQLKQQGVSQEFQTWIAELKDNADIKHFVEY